MDFACNSHLKPEETGSSSPGESMHGKEEIREWLYLQLHQTSLEFSVSTKHAYL